MLSVLFWSCDSLQWSFGHNQWTHSMIWLIIQVPAVTFGVIAVWWWTMYEQFITLFVCRWQIKRVHCDGIMVSLVVLCSPNISMVSFLYWRRFLSPYRKWLSWTWDLPHDLPFCLCIRWIDRMNFASTQWWTQGKILSDCSVRGSLCFIVGTVDVDFLSHFWKRDAKCQRMIYSVAGLYCCP